MARNTITLQNPNDKIGVYSEALVNGSDGDQTVLINSSASGVEITSTVERADFALNSADVSFSFNTSTFKIEVSHNGNVIAVVNNDSLDGTNLAFKDGSVNVKLDANTAGDNVLRITGKDAATQDIPLDGSQASLSAPVDTSVRSELGGNGGGGEEPSETPTYDLATEEAKIDTAIANGTPYNLKGDAASIKAAPYAQVQNATKITLQDDLIDLLKSDGTLTDNAKAALAIDKVTAVQHALKRDFRTAKTVTYVIDATSTSRVSLDTATVAQATGAKEQINTFLADTTITKKMSDDSKVPTEFTGTVDIKEIADTAANIAKAAESVLKAATTVTVEDDIAGVQANLKVLDNTLVKAVDIEDTLANIADVPTAIFDKLTALTTSWTATDTESVTLAYNAAFFNDSTARDPYAPKLAINFDSLAKDATVTLDASKVADTTKVGESGKSIDLNDLFVFIDENAATHKVDFTGSKQADVITAHNNGGTIDGNGGKDEITLGDGKDTVVLGNGWELPVTAGEDETNMVTVASFVSGTDKIDLQGVLAGYTKGTGITDLNTPASIANGKVYVSSVTSKGTLANDNFTGLAKGESAIVAMTEGTGKTTTIYYIEGADGDLAISTTADIVVKLGTITDIAVALDDFNFA